MYIQFLIEEPQEKGHLRDHVADEWIILQRIIKNTL
jgi:hypothetical protein